MEPLSLWVPGIALSERKRNVRMGGFNRTVDTPERRDWKAYVKHCAAQACPEPFAPKTPLVVNLTFVRTRPKSLPKRVVWPLTRPDLDNCTKTIWDALTGVVFADDAQVVLLVVTKCFGAAPGVDICVSVTAPLDVTADAD